MHASITSYCPVCCREDHLAVEQCPEVWIDHATGVRVFMPEWGDGQAYDTREAYDFTQTNEAMRDGDVVVCQHEGREVVAILVEAWPVAISGMDEERQAGSMHALDHPADWHSLDGGKYLLSIDATERWAVRG